MFPNNMEFFVKERIAERYAEAEQARLAQEFTKEGWLRLKPRLGHLVYWLGRRLIGWSELLSVSDKAAVVDQPEHLTS
jgi:hypothetical protein